MPGEGVARPRYVIVALPFFWCQIKFGFYKPLVPQFVVGLDDVGLKLRVLRDELHLSLKNPLCDVSVRCKGRFRVLKKRQAGPQLAVFHVVRDRFLDHLLFHLLVQSNLLQILTVAAFCAVPAADASVFGICAQSFNSPELRFVPHDRVCMIAGVPSERYLPSLLLHVPRTVGVCAYRYRLSASTVYLFRGVKIIIVISFS